MNIISGGNPFVTHLVIPNSNNTRGANGNERGSACTSVHERGSHATCVQCERATVSCLLLFTSLKVLFLRSLRIFHISNRVSLL